MWRSRSRTFYMVTLKDLRILTSIPQVPADKVRWLWHCGYWDGPLSGVVIYNGEKMWVDTFDHVFVPPESEMRRMAIVRLTPEEWELEEKDHERFEKYVGRHTSYGEDGKRNVGALHPRENWDEYYSQAVVKPNYQDHEVVGWFEW